MERLITFVKDYPLLYDMTDKEYKDNLKKVAAWNEIAHHLKLESGKSTEPPAPRRACLIGPGTAGAGHLFGLFAFGVAT